MSIRKIGPRTYGSALGNYLRTIRGEIAAKEAGEDGDAQAGAAALAEELAGACGVDADGYSKVESGDVDLTAEQADAVAAVLVAHGIDAAGADLLALDAAADDDDEEDEEDDDDEQGSATEELRAGMEQAQTQVKTLRADLDTERQRGSENAAELVRLREQVTADAAFVAAGRVALTERRASLVQRLTLRHGSLDKVPAKLREAVEKADLAGVEMLEAATGIDPRVDPMCSACGEKAAGTVYRSSEAPKPGARVAAAVAHVGPPSGQDIARAARAYQRKQESETKERVPYRDATAAVRLLTHDEIFALANEA